MLNFKELNTGNTVDTITNPRDLFTALPAKNQKYQYPRDVQSQVWTQWNERKNEKDLIVKMNTGSGKTVVGLIMLKSSMNESIRPAVYLVPNKFLVKQVITEALELGIPVTDDIDSTGFRRGNEILVCTIHKLINGKSKFGVGSKRIEIGSVLVDDAHACIETVEKQYTISIKNTNPIYEQLLNTFLPSIKTQSETKAIELQNNQPNTIALVPFWSWKEKLSEVTKLLLENISHEDLEFSLPLLKENLNLCRCVLSDTSIEITPHSIPTDVILSLEYAQRKIFMTATLVDDSILSTHFNIDRESIINPITPLTAGDLGERMILIPQELNSDISDDELKSYYKTLSQTNNVVIIVPSFPRANYWKDIADLIINKENIEVEIEKLRTSHVGLVILVNRYDGIDLPQNACRILVIDGLPDARRLIDQIVEGQLIGSDKSINQKIQKIEQGMGRGVRSNDDYCVVFLMGKNLIQHLYSIDTIDKFSQATRAQFNLSESLSKQLKGATLSDINEAVQHALNRNPDWVSSSKSTLTSLSYLQSAPDDFSIAQRLAFNEASIQQYDRAVTIINDAITQLNDSDKIMLGFSKQILAEYVNYTNEVEAQTILLSAIALNKQILKPKQGISYQKIKAVDEQANILQQNLTSKYNTNKNQFIIDIDAILDDLIFKPGTANKFEEAIKRLGFFLGFVAQRPENDFGRGPDNLWIGGKQNYFVIECKNGVTNPIINKHDMNQLNGSVAWFKKEYHDIGTVLPFMIHLGDICEFGATPLPECKVMTIEKLEVFKTNIKNCMYALKDNFNNLDEIKKLLTHHNLRDIDIMSSYTKDIKVK